MMKKLLKITKIATLTKSAYKCQRYQYQIMIAQIEDLNKDYVKISKSLSFTLSEKEAVK